MPDFVLLYAPPWSGPTRFSKHHLATYLAERGHRVLYVESPLTPLSIRRGRSFFGELRETQFRPREVSERLWVRRYFLPLPFHSITPVTSHRVANRIGQRLLARVLRRDLHCLGIDKPVLIAGLPQVVDLLSQVPRRALVYHCADDYVHVHGFPKTLSQLEGELCKRADLVITTSETLCEERKRFNANTHWVPNGADVDHFSKSVPPADDLCNLRKPVIGFVGGLSEWVDLGVVATLARRRPEWTFVLVGPITIDASAVNGLPNVKLLGPRPYAVVPSYLAGMDVGLIPFKQNEVTYHADPIKAYEYLAAGLPVVATDLPALRRLQHVVRLGNSAAALLRGIDEALVDTRVDERRAEATRHSWSSRFGEVERLIDDVLACAS